MVTLRQEPAKRHECHFYAFLSIRVLVFVDGLFKVSFSGIQIIGT
jgi:hypothetical protein